MVGGWAKLFDAARNSSRGVRISGEIRWGDPGGLPGADITWFRFSTGGLMDATR